MTDHLRHLYEVELPAIASRLGDWTLQYLKIHGVNQWGEGDCTKMVGRVEYRDGRPHYCYSPRNWSGGQPRRQATIEFSNLRTGDTSEVDVMALDKSPQGKGRLRVASWTNKSPVEFRESIRSADRSADRTSKSASATVTASTEFHAEAEARAGIKLAEASAKTSLTTRLETVAGLELKQVLSRERENVSGREFTVPGWCEFRVHMSYDRVRATQRIRYHGVLEADVRLHGQSMFDYTFQGFADLADCFRGLQGDRRKPLSRVYQESPMSDAAVGNMLSRPPVVIDVVKQFDSAENFELVTDYDEIKH